MERSRAELRVFAKTFEYQIVTGVSCTDCGSSLQFECTSKSSGRTRRPHIARTKAYLRMIDV